MADMSAVAFEHSFLGFRSSRDPQLNHKRSGAHPGSARFWDTGIGLHFRSFVVQLLAEPGRKQLKMFVLGPEQEPAVYFAATSSVGLAAQEINSTGCEQANKPGLHL